MYFVLDYDDSFFVDGESGMDLYISAVHIEASNRKITMLYHIFCMITLHNQQNYQYYYEIIN
jgi:hypothetical protein